MAALFFVACPIFHPQFSVAFGRAIARSGKAMQARPRPSSSPATRSQPLSCDFPDQPRDEVALGLFGCASSD